MRLRISYAGYVLLLLCLAFYGCATTEDVQILDKENRRLYAALDRNHKDIESLKQEIATLKQEAEKERATLRKEDQGAWADLLLRVENLQSEVRMLMAGVEEYKDFAKKPSKEVDRMREDVAFRIRILEEKTKSFEEKQKAQEERNRIQDERSRTQEERMRALEDRLKGLDTRIEQLASRPPEPEKTALPKETPPEGKGPLTVAGSLYKDAYETFQKGDMEGARRKLEAFLKQYPNTELSDNAQFWIAETYYQRKDFEKAILEYEKVIVKFPEGDKVPSALFKQALAFLELGDKTNARGLLRRVIEKYPHSEQAELAKKRLDTLK